MNWISARSELALCGSLVRTASRINHWGIFVPSIAYHWYFENESRIIPETLQHVHVRKTKASFKFLMDYSLKNTQSALPLLSLKHNSSKSIAISQSSVIIKLSKRHNESLIYITSALMRWFTSMQNSGAGEWILKNCNVSDWPLRWRNQNMSLIGYIAQRCKNTLDSLLNLLSAFAFVWGYLNS